ncbi:MAG: hypothetical protein WCB05_03105 [Candidatus Sulfotelmatobacter sp.]
MNSISAGDRGGKVPFVEDGSFLLGAPGAPGCTTAGFDGSVCCARIPEAKKTVKTVAMSSPEDRSPTPRAKANPDRRRGRILGQERLRLKMDILHEVLIFSRNAKVFKGGQGLDAGRMSSHTTGVGPSKQST